LWSGVMQLRDGLNVVIDKFVEPAMNISELSIKRPVLATVVVLVITLFGLIGIHVFGHAGISQCGPTHYYSQYQLSGSQCRGNHESDYRAFGAKHQRHSRYSLFEQCKQPRHVNG